MALIVDVEDVIGELMEIYATNLGAALTTIETAYGDGITLDEMDAYLWAPMTTHAKFPYSVIIADETIDDDPSGGSGYGSHNIRLICFMRYGEKSGLLTPQQVTAKKLYRTMKAFKDIAKANLNLPGLATEEVLVMTVGPIQYRDFEFAAASGLSGILNHKIMTEG